MKPNNKMLIACSIIITFLFSSCFRDNTNISIHDERNSYQFYASYNKSKTENVLHYLNENLNNDNGYFSDLNYIDVTTTLHDDTKLYIKATPGRIKIKLDKRENTEASYKRVKHICNELKDVLK